MTENIEIKTEAKENKMSKIAKWCSDNSEGIFSAALILGMIGTVAGLSIASIKSDERVKKAKLEDKAAERALQEKWMDVQLECAKIEADAFVRKETATTNDIASIVKTMKE
jgi:hypothetical protein